MPLKQASHHPGGFTGRGRAHSRKKGGCPPAGLSFLPFCVSVRPSVWAPHLSTCLSQCSLEPCPSVCSSVWVCLCVCPPSWACPSAYVCLPAHLCVYVGQLCVSLRRQRHKQAGKVSWPPPAAGGQASEWAGPGARLLQVAQQGLLVVHLVGAHGACSVKDRVQSLLVEHVHLQAGAWALSADRRGSWLLGHTLSAQPPAAPPTGRAWSLPLSLRTFGASTRGPSPPLTSADPHGEAGPPSPNPPPSYLLLAQSSQATAGVHGLCGGR